RSSGLARRWPLHLAIATGLMAASALATWVGWWPAGPSSRAAAPAYRATDYQESLFFGSLQGWFPPAEGGRWSMVKDDEQGHVLTGTGFVRRRFTKLSNYRLTLGLDLFKAEAAEVHFAIPEHPSAISDRLVLRITRETGAVLGSKTN